MTHQLRLVSDDLPEPERRKTTKRVYERDPVWDEMELHFGRVVSGTAAHKKRNRAVADLKLLEATPETIRRAVRAYREQFAGVAMTDTALAVHYPLLAPKPVSVPCASCGIGGGMHEVDCPEVRVPQDAKNARPG